jgi:hypothetical protein
MSSNRCIIPLLVAAIGFTFHSEAGATSIHVSPKADIYLAGGNIRVGSNGENPSDFSFSAAPGLDLTFDVTGSATPFGAGTPMLGADGNLGALGGLPDIGALSGVTYPGMSSLPLFGVLLGNTLPTTPPAGIGFFTQGVAFDALSPLLGQVFWIGDGLTGTGSGAGQVFHVPTGATHLYLGFIDDAGAYHDNVGGFDVDIHSRAPDSTPNPVPEPSSVLLMLTGAAAARRFRQTV